MPVSGLVKGWWVASSYPAAARTSPAVASQRARNEARKMRVTDFCNRLPLRAPSRLLDSRWQPVPCSALRRLATRARRPILGVSQLATGLGTSPCACRMSQPGGASLDGETSSFDAAATVTSTRRSRAWCLAVLAEPRFVAPPRCTARRWLFDHAPSSRHRLWRPLSRSAADAASLPQPLRLESPGPRPPPSRQRPRLRRTRTPSIVECSLPLSRTALARMHVGSRGARHRLAARVLWLSPPRTGFRRLFAR